MAEEKKKPRVRKVETVRDRNAKASEKAALEAGKVKKRPIRKAARFIAKPLGVAARPFKVRPVRFIFRWLGRILWPRYFRNSYRELRQVKWPSRRETWKLTLAVLLFATVFGTLVTLTDLGLDKVIKRIVLR